MPARCAGQRQPQVLHIEPGSQPERAHEHRLAHSVDLAQGRPVGIRRDGALPVDLRIEDLANDPEDAPDADPDGFPQGASQAERQEDDPASGQVGFV